MEIQEGGGDVAGERHTFWRAVPYPELAGVVAPLESGDARHPPTLDETKSSTKGYEYFSCEAALFIRQRMFSRK